MTDPDPAVLGQLRQIVGAQRVLTDADSLAQFGCDWTRVYTPNPVAVVLPGSIEEVQDVVRLAAREQLAIVPSGGRTGLSAGAVACKGELVVALDRPYEVLSRVPQAPLMEVQGDIQATMALRAAL